MLSYISRGPISDEPRSHTDSNGEWRAGSETLGHVTRARSRLNNRIRNPSALQKYTNRSLCQTMKVATSNKGNPLNANFV